MPARQEPLPAEPGQISKFALRIPAWMRSEIRDFATFDGISENAEMLHLLRVALSQRRERRGV